MMLGPNAEQRCDCLARAGGPTREPVDEQQLAIAARDPIGGKRGKNYIELSVREVWHRPDFVPLTEAVAGRETPGGGEPGVPSQWERKSPKGGQGNPPPVPGPLPPPVGRELSS